MLTWPPPAPLHTITRNKNFSICLKYRWVISSKLAELASPQHNSESFLSPKKTPWLHLH